MGKNTENQFNNQITKYDEVSAFCASLVDV